MLTGRRYGGIDAAANGIVDEAVPEPDVLPRGARVCWTLASKDAGTLGTIKARPYADVVATLRDRLAKGSSVHLSGSAHTAAR